MDETFNNDLENVIREFERNFHTDNKKRASNHTGGDISGIDGNLMYFGELYEKNGQKYLKLDNGGMRVFTEKEREFIIKSFTDKGYNLVNQNG